MILKAVCYSAYPSTRAFRPQSGGYPMPPYYMIQISRYEQSPSLGQKFTVLATQGLNTGGIEGISLVVTTCASPSPMSLERFLYGVLAPIEGSPFVVPIHYIVCDCAHYNPNTQQTFRPAHDQSYH